jgi:hypothetical protein
MRLAAVLALMAATVMPAAARAESVDELFHAFWLLGTWAPDCKLAAAPKNPHVRITMSDTGQVLEDHDLGAGVAINHYRIVSAKRLSDERLSVEAIFQPGQATEERDRLIFRLRGGTRRTMFNQPDGGEVRVKEGVVLSNGRETPLLHKCD